MTKRSSRILSLLLAVLMFAMVLAGCKNDKNDPTTATPTTPSNPSSGTTSGGDVGPTYTVSDIANALAGTVYANTDYAGKAGYGLSDIGNVGVIGSEVRELYPVPADGTYEDGCVIAVDDITLAQVQQFYPTVTEADDYDRINTAVSLAKAKNDAGKAVKIRFSAKTYEIDGNRTGSRAFVLTGLNGTAFEGNGAVILVKNHGTAWRGFVDLTESSNVLIHGLTFRQAVPSSLVGIVTDASVTDRTVTIKVDPEFHPLVAVLLETNAKLESCAEYNYATKAPLLGGNFVAGYQYFDGYTITGDATEGYTITVRHKGTITRPRNGSFVSLQYSQYGSNTSGINVTNSSDITFENVTVNDASGMAFVAQRVTNFHVNRFNLVPKEGSNALMTATADAMHFVLMHGDVSITGSTIFGSHDDALNIKYGYWYKLTSAEGGAVKKMTVAQMTGSVETPKVGDKICVYNQNTFEGHNPSSGYYTIASVTKTANGYELTVKERMSNVGDWGTCLVTFVSDAPNFTFRNNVIKNKRNRGILVQIPDALVENNTFINVGHGSIQAASAMDQFNECTVPQAIVIRNNKFISNCTIKPGPLYGDISVFAIASNGTVGPAGTIHNVLIENNFMTDNGNAAVSMRGVGDSTVKNNLFYNCSSSQPSGETCNAVFQFNNCDGITLDGNYNYYDLGLGQQGILCQGLTSEKMIDLRENNTGIAFQESDDEGPRVTVSKATGSITLDGKLTEWDSIGATDVEIVGISDAEGAARTAAEIADNFAVRRLMITHTDDGIYLAFDVKDNKIECKTINDFWLGDCVELFLSTVTTFPNADMQVYKEQGAVMQAAFAPSWESMGYKTIASVRTNSGIVKNADKLQAKMELTSDGYTGEIFISYELSSDLKAAVTAGNPIDMAIICADCERKNGLKRVQAGNVPHFVENYKTKTARMPQYIFE